MARYNPSRHYCSSKPVEWLRDTVFKIDKPKALPWGGWEVWYDELKSTRPVAYFITEVLPVWLEQIPNHTTKYVSDFRRYFNARVNHSHGLSSSLAKGKYHEMPNRILYSLFDSFAEYIEVDEAYSTITWGDPDDVQAYKVPFTKRHSMLNWGKHWPCPKAGIKKLQWEMSLQYENDPVQVNMAIQKMILYSWWRTIRPARGDSWDVSGFRKFWKEMEEKYGEDFTLRRSSWRPNVANIKNNGMTTEERAEYKRLSAVKSAIEQQWEREDEEMLIRLIKIRKTLWT